jgi:hypothetical protein
MHETLRIPILGAYLASRGRMAVTLALPSPVAPELISGQDEHDRIALHEEPEVFVGEEGSGTPPGRRAITPIEAEASQVRWHLGEQFSHTCLDFLNVLLPPASQPGLVGACDEGCGGARNEE